MQQIDDQFLIETGLGAMPPRDRPAFLQHVYDTLQLRVGTQLSNGLSDDQLEEFEKIIEHDADVVVAWIEQHASDFLEDPVYLRTKEMLSAKAGAGETLCEYAATKWLEVNRGDYRQIVAQEIDALKAEVSALAAQILAPYGPTAHTESG